MNHPAELDDVADRIQRAWSRERPGTEVGTIAVVTRLLRIAKLLQDDQRRLLAGLDVDAATRDLLSTLRRAGEPYRMSAGDLARNSLVSTGAMSQRLEKAEARGLVRRVRSAYDGRSVLVELTPEGHELIERTVDVLFERERELLSGLTGDEYHDLAELLRTLLRELRTKLGVADWP